MLFFHEVFLVVLISSTPEKFTFPLWLLSFFISGRLTYQDLHTLRQKGNPRWHAWCESRLFPGLWISFQSSIIETDFLNRHTPTRGTSSPLALEYVDMRRLREALTSRVTSLPSCTVQWVSMPRELPVTCSSFHSFSI